MSRGAKTHALGGHLGVRAAVAVGREQGLDVDKNRCGRGLACERAD